MEQTWMCLLEIISPNKMKVHLNILAMIVQNGIGCKIRGRNILKEESNRDLDQYT